MANKYRLPGSGNWNDTLYWSLTDGGASGAAVPSSADDVYFTATTGNGTTTVNVAASMKSLNMTGFTGTLAGAFGSSIYGNITFGAGMTNSYTGTITLSGACVITTNGIHVNSNLQWLTNAWPLTFADDFTADSTKNLLTVSVTSGTLSVTAINRVITNLQISQFQKSGTNTIDITGTTWDTGTGDWLLNVSGTVNVTTTGSTVKVGGVFNTGGTSSYNNVEMKAGSGYLSTGTSSIANLVITGHASQIDTHNFMNNVTIPNLKIVGASAAYPVLITTTSNNKVLTVTSFDAASNNVIFQGVTISGAAAPISANALSDRGGNSGITFTNERHWVGGTGNLNDTAHWAKVSGGVGGQILPNVNDVVYFDSGSAAANYTVSSAATGVLGKSLICSAPSSGNLTLTLGHDMTIYGDMTFYSGMTLSGAGNITFAANATLTSNGKTRAGAMYISSGATVMLADDAGWNGLYFLSNQTGTLDLNGHIFTGAGFTANSNSTASAINGTIILTGNGGNVINISSTATISNTTGLTIKLTDTGTSAKTILLNGKAINNLWLAGRTYSIATNGTLNGYFKADYVANAHTITFTSGVTLNVGGDIVINGVAGKLISLAASSTTNYTLSKASGMVSCDYLSISKCTIAGNAQFYAGTHSTNGGGNVGWTFSDPPKAGGAFLSFFI